MSTIYSCYSVHNKKKNKKILSGRCPVFWKSNCNFEFNTSFHLYCDKIGYFNVLEKMSNLQFLDLFVFMHLTTQKTAMNNATIPAMIPNTTPTMCPGLK